MANTTKTTLKYYNEHAVDYKKETQQLAMEDLPLLKTFYSYLPDPHGHVLDLGCGVGRDSKAFIQLGCQVTAVDGSPYVCKIASDFIGQNVICATFEEYKTDEIFDGIWACAALLHLSCEDIIQVMNRLDKNLKKNGCFYVSFKYGNFSGIRNGRFFQDMTEESFQDLIKNMQNYELISTIITPDLRPSHENERWFNAFLKRK